MKLLGTVGSPYARKARIVAEEKLIPYDCIIASPSDPNSGVQAANPLGKIPVLIVTMVVHFMTHQSLLSILIL